MPTNPLYLSAGERPKYVTPAEACAYLRLSRAAIHRLLGEQLLAGYRRGRIVRITAASVYAFERHNATTDAAKQVRNA
ncbi:MAG TPA: helix-turn-helix domain-containing protein [Candidatus Baltobacteraceae bacterium]